ncbi:hypothetical protein QSV34_03130 [Porticoccus sp. W117]|uniref:hypothetical protein n=1 Tax=Porticoccus sp. W117 TaxID=3054777 RepID=UPI00259498C1|nr:hypothetical protein [Porticoccus sp. W117]MDM3870342.1 hypothetical protein [Porticoccus sp. W117]
MNFKKFLIYVLLVGFSFSMPVLSATKSGNLSAGPWGGRTSTVFTRYENDDMYFRLRMYTYGSAKVHMELYSFWGWDPRVVYEDIRENEEHNYTYDYDLDSKVLRIILISKNKELYSKVVEDFKGVDMLFDRCSVGAYFSYEINW